MIKFHKIEPGMTLYDCRRTKMGNTTMSEWSCWKVAVVSVDREARTAIASWNGNPARTYTRRQLERLSRSEPKAYREQQERHSRRSGGWR